MIKHLLPFLTTTSLFLLTTVAHAQTYQPSNRIPIADNSQIRTQVSGTNNNFKIDGGLQRGHNLFHSFSDFSVPTGGSANFTNLARNQSIITRVTGNLFSDINGLLNTNGANFLLINPNGVVFGTGVKLDVGKAFVTSTASGVDFVDAAGRNYNFGVNRAGDAPLLTIDPNVAFNPARLIMNASIPGSKGIENYGILQTKNPGQYIGLIGGDVNFYGGQLIAPGAKVELGGLKQNSTIRFSLENGVQFPANVDRGNVSLVSIGTSPSIIDVRSGGDGSVRIVAKDITLQGTRTRIKAGILAGLGSPSATAGDIKLDATGDIRISDTAAIVSSVNFESQGKGGEIEIVTGNLYITNGAGISASTFGKGDAGNVKVTAKDTVFLADAIIFSTVELGSVGKGGNIDIIAGSLSLRDGAQLSTGIRDANGTEPTGTGDAGNINLKVSGAVDIAGKKDIFSSGILSYLGTDAVGNGGNINIDAGSFTLRDGAQFSAATYGQGNAGSITINTTDFVTITGKSGSSNSALFVDSQSQTGKAGNLIVRSPQITLDNGGKINAGSFSGNGGNIKIQQADLLLLRRGGQITTNAGGTPQVGGNGGNINIDSKLIVAIPSDNSDISANAVKGRGGNVNINTQGLFGIQFRSSPTDESDITASSTFGQSGIVQITTPGTDPGKDKGELVAVPNDASNQISQACGASQRDNKFYITGRGGLPPTASEPQESEALWSDSRAVKMKPATTANLPPKYAPPAIGWVFEQNGRVRLIAAQTAAEPTGTRVACPTVRK
jgi:filamentous hemagglutinin family protein